MTRLEQIDSHPAALVLAAALLAGGVLLLRPVAAPRRTTDHQPQPTLYRQIPALLARSPLRALPHARWFVRVRHGRAEVVIQDGPMQTFSAPAVTAHRGEGARYGEA